MFRNITLGYKFEHEDQFFFYIWDPDNGKFASINLPVYLKRRSELMVRSIEMSNTSLER